LSGKEVVTEKMAFKQVNEGSTPIEVLSRRVAGERWWKVEIENVMGNFKLMVQEIRGMRDLHPNDLRVQVLAADALENMVLSLVTLQELYHYRDPEEKKGTVKANGSVNGGTREGGDLGRDER
jgi:hypothetical protein